MKQGVVCLVVLALASACRQEPKPDGPVAQAEFGVLYGGQIQQREQIPFELDRRKLTLVLRLVFHRPLSREARISWSLEMPGTSRGVRDAEGRRGAGRLAKVDETRLPPGRDRFDQVIPLSPGDPLGNWRIRAEVDGKPVLDRAFHLYDPAVGASPIGASPIGASPIGASPIGASPIGNGGVGDGGGAKR